MIEPVQGEGGFVVAPQEFMEGVRRICDDNGIVLVVDEVQTGFGRTGKFFAIEHYGVEPDLITVAKSIAGGPAALGRARPRGDHGRARRRTRSAARTSAIPVAQAAALAVLDVIDEEGLVERAARDRRDDPGPDAGVAGAVRGDRRRPRARRDAGDRARPRPRVEGSRAGARRRPSATRRFAQRPAAARAPGSTPTSSACSSRSTIADARARRGARASGSRRSSASSASAAGIGA